MASFLHLDKIGKYLFALAFTVTYLVHVNVVEYDLVHVSRISDVRTISSSSGGGHIYQTTTSNSRAWTESHSPYHIMDPDVRISFRLHDPADVSPPSKFLSVVPYMCSGPGSKDKAEQLPPPLSTVLNFTTTIATDLKIVHVGDSLGQQFVQGFDASVLGAGHDDHRVVLQEYFYEGKIYSHNCLSVAAPVRGGGISSYWRVTDLISKGNRRKEAACAKEELQLKQRVGWSMEQSIALVDHKFGNGNNNSVSESSDVLESSFAVGQFDSVVMRIPHGWMDIPDITRERIVEAIQLSGENLGVQTVILTTLPLNNNVLTTSDWQGIHDINKIIRDIARTWTPVPGIGVQWILVQEFGDFTNQILWKNAQHLGYATESTTDNAPKKQQQQQHQQHDGWELSGGEFLLDRLPLAKRKWPPSIPMVCAEKPAPEAKNCIRNKISTDGIHWCIETLGPRYAASVACLLGCVYNGKGPRGSNDRDVGDVRKCEEECNDQFMSITPVDERWIGGEAVIFSRAGET